MTAIYPTATPLANLVVIRCPSLVPHCVPQPIIVTTLNPSACAPASGPRSLRFRRLLGAESPASWADVMVEPLPRAPPLDGDCLVV